MLLGTDDKVVANIYELVLLAFCGLVRVRVFCSMDSWTDRGTNVRTHLAHVLCRSIAAYHTFHSSDHLLSYLCPVPFGWCTLRNNEFEHQSNALKSSLNGLISSVYISALFRPSEFQPMSQPKKQMREHTYDLSECYNNT